MISEERVEMDPRKVSAIVQWSTSRSVKAMRGILGITGYYRRFIKGYGQMAQSLTGLLKKENN